VLVCAALAASGVWSAPVTLSTPIPPTYYATSPAVDVNSSGAHAAAWVNEDNYLLLQVAAQDAGGSWSQAQTLTPRSGANAADPAVAIGPSGNAVAMWDLWQTNSSQGTVIQASSRPAHGSWSAAVSLTSPTTSSSSQSQVGMDANGNAVAIWLQTTSTSSAIETANLPNGGSWTAPAPISTPGVSASNPTLAVNAPGDAVATWQTASGQIFVAERTSQVWGAPISIAPPSFRQGSPHVALNDRGDAALAWSGRGTTFVATRPAGGAWSAPTKVSATSAGATARIAIDYAGNAVALFELVKSTGSGYVYPLQAVSHPAGGSWGAPATISGVNETAASPNIVATPLGTFVAAWTESATGAVKAVIRPAGQTAFGAATVIGYGSQPFLAVAAGKTAATWIGPGPAVQVSDANTP